MRTPGSAPFLPEAMEVLPLTYLGSQDERIGLPFALISGPVNTRIACKAGLVQLDVLTVLPSLNSLTLLFREEKLKSPQAY